MAVIFLTIHQLASSGNLCDWQSGCWEQLTAATGSEGVARERWAGQQGDDRTVAALTGFGIVHRKKDCVQL
ncbi:hypothetical protein [Desulfobulbus elongatus]|uniref:hypothetical protein n=1 Tax=Desulfobulbus elongatus TaxID=53332 RepID=UPI0012F70C39|nr:hypothetical protein [Desulfobulbus elongatus]